MSAGNPKPSKPARWPGEADPKHFLTVTADGTPTSADRTIVPLAKQYPDGTWALVGTGFFIATNGLVATARHVATDVIDQEKMKQIAALAVFQFQDDNRYIIRPALRVSWHNHADVAVIVLAEMKHNTTGALLTNSVVRLSGAPVNDGEHVFTYAYPKSRFEGNRFNVQATFFNGHVQEFLPNGRDRTLLPNPCYRTSMHIHGGASGGPVFAPNGSVFGINSTGWDGTDLSFISRINELLPLEITGVKFEGDTVERSTTVEELVRRGFITMTNPEPSQQPGRS